MYGLGMPTCDTVSKIDEIAEFTGLISKPIKALIATSKDPDIDAFLKLHTFWFMLHGLISINMMNNNVDKLEFNQLVIQDFIKGFISGIRG